MDIESLNTADKKYLLETWSALQSLSRNRLSDFVTFKFNSIHLQNSSPKKITEALGILREMGAIKIQDDIRNQPLNYLEGFFIEILRPTFNAITDTLHLPLVKEENGKIVGNNQPKFDVASGYLTFNDKSIKIGNNSNQFELCKTLFQSAKSMKKTWNQDKMLEKFGREWSVPKRTVENAARYVNSKISQQTRVNDLIIYDNKTVRVNPQYLQ